MASSSAGDCAFEDDMCGWSNPGPTDSMDELNWERLEARSEQRFPQVSLFISLKKLIIMFVRLQVNNVCGSLLAIFK